MRAYGASVAESAASGHEEATRSSHGAARTRVVVAFGVGALAFGLAMLVTPWQVSALIGWNVAAIVFMTWSG